MAGAFIGPARVIFLSSGLLNEPRLASRSGRYVQWRPRRKEMAGQAFLVPMNMEKPDRGES